MKIKIKEAKGLEPCNVCNGTGYQRVSRYFLFRGRVTVDRKCRACRGTGYQD